MSLTRAGVRRIQCVVASSSRTRRRLSSAPGGAMSEVRVAAARRCADVRRHFRRDGLKQWNNTSVTIVNAALALRTENGTSISLTDETAIGSWSSAAAQTLSFVNVEFRPRRPFLAQTSSLTFIGCTIADNRVTGSAARYWCASFVLSTHDRLCCQRQQLHVCAQRCRRRWRSVVGQQQRDAGRRIAVGIADRLRGSPTMSPTARRVVDGGVVRIVSVARRHCRDETTALDQLSV